MNAAQLVNSAILGVSFGTCKAATTSLIAWSKVDSVGSYSILNIYGPERFGVKNYESLNHDYPFV